MSLQDAVDYAQHRQNIERGEYRAWAENKTEAITEAEVFDIREKCAEGKATLAEVQKLLA